MMGLSFDVLLLDMLEALIFVVLLHRFTKGTQRKQRYFVFLFFVISMYVRSLLNDTGYIYGLYSTISVECLMLLCCVLLSTYSLSLIVFLCNFLCFMNITCYIFSIYLFNVFAEVSVPIMLQDAFYYDITVFFAKVLFLIVGVSLSNRIQELMKLKLETDWWYAGCIFFLLFVMFDQCSRVILTSKMQMYDLYVIFFSLVGLIGMLLHLMKSVHNLIQNRALVEVKRLELHGQKENYEFQDETMKKLRALRHDFKYLKDYIDHSTEENKEDILCHLDQLSHYIEVENEVMLTGNPIYDMLMNEQASNCAHHQVTTQLLATSMDTSAFHEYELYQALSEVYQYAIQKAAPRQQMTVQLYTLEDCYHAVISFKCKDNKGTLYHKNPAWLMSMFPKATKLAKEYHGEVTYDEEHDVVLGFMLHYPSGKESV